MSTRILFTLGSATILIGVELVSVFGHGRPTEEMKPGGPARQAVVVELFTSEGCSSCPPADELLKKLSEEQPVAGAEIIALEEHVDYWNQLGWKDPFSSSEFSERQSEYASRLRNRNVYTPQMIIDGQTEFAGGHASEAREAVRRAAGTAKVELQLTRKPGANRDTATFEAQIHQRPGGRDLELWVAVTEKNLRVDVKAGENSGRALAHAPVVRLLKKTGTLSASGVPGMEFSVKLQSDWRRENLSVVAFLVERGTGRIAGAARLPAGD
ncbi:MAG TPA: DUF1223 domain-containing protein [Candidatus Acidoferrum sp.]